MSLFAFLIKNFTIIHAGTASQKTLAAVKLAAVPAVGLTLSERFAGWYIDNAAFISFVLIAICIDAIVGAWVHYIKHDFNFRKLFWGFATKTMVLVFGYVLFEMIHQIVQDVEIIATYFKVTLQLVVMLYPAGSVLGNISYLTNGKFPPIGWMKRLERFNLEGNIEILKPNKDESTDTTDAGCDAADGLPNKE